MPERNRLSAEERERRKKAMAEHIARGKAKHAAWLEKVGYAKTPPATAIEQTATPREDLTDALDAALQKTEVGRRMLTLLEAVARLRIHETLAAELVRGSAEDVDALKRAPCGRDLIARENAAARLPSAQATLSKWQRAHAEYRTRREHCEYVMRDLARALPL